MNMRLARSCFSLVKWNQFHRQFSSKHYGSSYNSEPLWHCPELGYRISSDEGIIFGPNGKPLKASPRNKNNHLHVHINKSRGDVAKVVWEHCHQEYLYNHFEITFKDGNINNVGRDNLDIKYKDAYISNNGSLIISKQPVICLDGYEELKEYPGYLINVKKGSVINGSTYIECGYVQCNQYVGMILKDSTGKWKGLYRSRVVYEHVNGKIEKGFHIDHIDGHTFNDSIDNLQKLTPKEHSLKTWSDTNNPKLVPICYRVPVPVIATEIDKNGKTIPGSFTEFASISLAARTLKVNGSCISDICNNKRKTAISKETGRRWTFTKVHNT